MANTDTPKDGDFAKAAEDMNKSVPPATGTEDSDEKTLIDVLMGAEPDKELLEGIAELEQTPPLSDEELERQALNHPGADEDPATPE